MTADHDGDSPQDHGDPLAAEAAGVLRLPSWRPLRTGSPRPPLGELGGVR